MQHILNPRKIYYSILIITILHNAINVQHSGTITFSDNKSNRAQFICIPPDASVTHVKKLMLRHWCQHKPSLVISITGGAKNYNMSGKLLRAFRRGLRKVATTTGAWIITGGMNTGIMKLVGDIVPTNPHNSRPIHIIGIATWGCVSNCDQLLVHGGNARYLKTPNEEKGQASLEPNHTEFIFINDGTQRKYGGEIVFRANLERAIAEGFFTPQSSSNVTDSHRRLSRGISISPESSDPVPVVLLVVEGGPNTVRTVHEAVVKNSIPAVFIQGTGRCCDLFAEALQVYDRCLAQPKHGAATKNTQPTTVQENNDELRYKLQEALKDIISEISGETAAKPGKKAQKPTVESKRPESETVDYFELVYECVVERRNFLSVVSLNPRDPVEPDIDVAILKALLNATPSSESIKTYNSRKYEQFRLALEWKRPDIVKKFIMTDDEDWKNPMLIGLFEKALNRKQTDFVKLFLDHDFPLTNLYRDQSKLLSLYKNSMENPCEIQGEKDYPLLAIYEHILQPSMGDFFDVDVALNAIKRPYHTHFSIQKMSARCPRCIPCGRSRQCQNEASSEAANTSPMEGDSEFHMDVDKELFLWSKKIFIIQSNHLYVKKNKNMFIFTIVILFLVSNHHRIYGQESDGKGANAKSTDVSVGCFSGDSLAMLANGERKQIGNLKIGDEILAVNQLKIVSSEMIIMLDKEKSRQAKFYTFLTDSGHQISLTGLHLIPINSSDEKIDYIPAKEIKLGDRFYVVVNGQLKHSSVINISIEFKTGYFAPLTMTGTLLVNDVFASCYASAKSHHFAQTFMAPFRWYYQLARFISISDPFNNTQTDGIHWLIKIIYQSIHYILPSTLQSF
ncbi:unnamed protein product [Rotaria magnacalcarata]